MILVLSLWHFISSACLFLPSAGALHNANIRFFTLSILHIPFILKVGLWYTETQAIKHHVSPEQTSFSVIQRHSAQHSSLTCYYSSGPSLPQAVELLLNRVIRLKSINPHLHLPPGSWQSSTHLSKKRNAPTHTHTHRLYVCSCVRVGICAAQGNTTLWCL